VISPEGCASILWKSAERAGDAAETMGITAQRLKSLGLVDRIINEPVGGAHRDYRAMAQNVRKALQEGLKQIAGLSSGELIERRFDRLMSYGRFKEQALH
jgi:acetyl-CoA carboxylase carboxyl transferase subunit alpha